METIALLPAGGQARRISPLPLSKELYPIGFRSQSDQAGYRPKVVSHYLLENLQRAGITRAYFILRPGKWDIPAYFGDGTIVNLALGYLVIQLPYGVPYTLDQAYPFVREARIALGFPDILLEPPDLFVHLLARQTRTQAEVVLGLLPCDCPQKAGMVRYQADGKVVQIVEKPETTDLRYMWAAAVWSPVFTEFLHEFVAARLPQFQQQWSNPLLPQIELPIGDVIQAAIASGLRVEAERFTQGTYRDIGTPADLIEATRQMLPPQGA